MTILLPIDLTDPSRELTAVAEAIKQHKAFGGELHLLTVVPEFNNKLFQVLYADNVGEQAVEHVKKLLEKFCQKYLPAEITYQTHIETGIVYKEILQKAKQINANLIVITASRPELADYLMGPNTGKVVRHSQCSVLVVRQDD
ncbi:MAG: universal stress protein UspA [Gammaproteobacteria bacterium]|nr:MAG: universal stress protein UspA [Gammaproteobacteria bacterium]